MNKDKRFTAEVCAAKGTVVTQVITDNETGVQYLLAVYPNVGSGLTVLVDREGKPVVK